jgi:hypothetical protein
MFEYIGAAVTLAAAIIGILGKTTDDAKQGLAHITGRGWAMLVFALLGGVVSAVSISRSNEEKLQAERQREQIRLIALNETEWALGLLLRPFTQLHPESAEARFNRGKSLLDAGAFQAFCKLRPKSPVSDADPSLLWGTFVRDVLREGSTELQGVITRYASHLDAETLLLIERVRYHPEIRALVLGHGWTDFLLKHEGLDVPFCGILPESKRESFERLAASIDALEKHLQRTRQPLVEKYSETGSR